MSTTTDFALVLQQRAMSPANTLTTIDNAVAGKVNQNNTATEDDAKAKEAANKFEALLIHSMLKGMRKTTMSENKSNDRAIYDDMLDEKLADSMMQAGGIGIADKIVAQIREQKGIQVTSQRSSTDIEKLRDLAQHIKRPASASNNLNTTFSAGDPQTTVGDVDSLALAKGLWGNSQQTPLTQKQLEFVHPLLPHARRNARILGTSPSAILAIAALETGWGNSMIRDGQGNNSHNLFGIKATNSDIQYTTTLTTEYIEGSPQKLQARFKNYDNHADAVNGFADFIRSNPRYENALKHAEDPEQFLKELQQAGYATDPRYADKAITIMRQISGNQLPL